MNLEVHVESRHILPTELLRIGIDIFTHEANGILGRHLISHLINLDASNRWMLKYFYSGSAHAIPEVISLIHELLERGTTKAFQGRGLESKALLFLLCRQFNFAVNMRLPNGVLHSHEVFGIADQNVQIVTSLNIPSKPDIIFPFEIDISEFIQAWLRSDRSIFVSALPHETPNMLHFGLAAVDPNFPWNEFEQFSDAVPVFRSVDQLFKRREFFRQRRLRMLYDDFARLKFMPKKPTKFGENPRLASWQDVEDALVEARICQVQVPPSNQP